MIPQQYYGGTWDLAWSGTTTMGWDPVRRLVVCDTSDAAATLRLPGATEWEIPPGPDLLRVFNDQASAVITVQDANGNAVTSIAAGVLASFSLVDDDGAGTWVRTDATTVLRRGPFSTTAKDHVRLEYSQDTTTIDLLADAVQQGYQQARPAFVTVDFAAAVVVQAPANANAVNVGLWPVGSEFLVTIRPQAVIQAGDNGYAFNFDAGSSTFSYRAWLDVGGTVDGTTASGAKAFRAKPPGSVTYGSGTINGTVESV